MKVVVQYTCVHVIIYIGYSSLHKHISYTFVYAIMHENIIIICSLTANKHRFSYQYIIFIPYVHTNIMKYLPDEEPVVLAVVVSVSVVVLSVTMVSARV